ncbi:MAG TPA: hypothetical protein VG838_04370 [Opitutaceae bacterium]|nr:hypothetical protein [Opitutaceae bacterium]
MKRLLPSFLVLLGVLVLPGCLFSRKSGRPKEKDPEVAASTEALFKQRWLEKRVTELKAAGATPDAAQSQAEEEFRARYSFTSAAGKK